MTDLNTFNPDWASLPGDSVLDCIEERGWTQAELAQRLGYSTSYLNRLINGHARLSDAAARRLGQALGNTAQFWRNREAQYRDRVSKPSLGVQPRPATASNSPGSVKTSARA